MRKQFGTSDSPHTSIVEETTAGVLDLVDPACRNIDDIEKLTVSKKAVSMKEG